MKLRAKAKWHPETKKFFRSTCSEWDFPDDEARVLFATCEQLNLYWTSTDELTKGGLTFTTSTGQIKKNPLADVVKNSWAGFLAGCRLLGICKQADQPKAGPGRPPSPSYYAGRGAFDAD